MSEDTMTPLGAITRGALAGAVGTLAMDLLHWARSRSDGAGQSFPQWEQPESASDYDEAGAPAEVGRRVVEDVLEVDLPERTAGAMTETVHWTTGLGNGVAHGLRAASTSASWVGGGLLTGVGAFATSYTLLPVMGLYEPLWEYDPETIWDDLSAHLVFGLATGLAFRLLGGGPRDPDG